MSLTLHGQKEKSSNANQGFYKECRDCEFKEGGIR